MRFGTQTSVRCRKGMKCGTHVTPAPSAEIQWGAMSAGELTTQLGMCSSIYLFRCSGVVLGMGGRGEAWVDDLTILRKCAVLAG